MQEDIPFLAQDGEKPFQCFEMELPQQWPSTQVNFLSLRMAVFTTHSFSFTCRTHGNSHSQPHNALKAIDVETMKNVKLCRTELCTSPRENTRVQELQSSSSPFQLHQNSYLGVL